jgi:hypothetical protein
MNDIISLAPFCCDVDVETISNRWKRWVSRFENYVLYVNVEDDTKKKSLLLHLAGDEVFCVYENIKQPNDNYKEAIKKLTDHFAPKQNTAFAVFKFRQCNQLEEESIDSYVHRLKDLAKDCSFQSTEDEIATQITQHCTSMVLKRQILQMETVKLDGILKIARTLENVDKQMKCLTSSNQLSINAISYQRNRSSANPDQFKRYAPNSTTSNNCSGCGNPLPHRTHCPAYGKSCNSCGKPNHFSKCCRSRLRMNSNGTKEVSFSLNGAQHQTYSSPRFQSTFRSNTASSNGETNSVENTPNIHKIVEQRNEDSRDSHENGYIYSVNDKVNQLPYVTLLINSTPVSMLIDTGASINIVDETTFNKLVPQPKLSFTNTVAYSYNADGPLKLIGEFIASAKSQSTCLKTRFVVVKGSNGSILSFSTSKELGLVQILNSITPQEQYPNLFNGVGKMKNVQIRIHVDDSVKPVQTQHRRIPFHVRSAVEAEIQRMLKDGIIEQVEGPTTWISPIVVVPKSSDYSKIRICLSACAVNRAILREKCNTPTFDDLLVDLNGAQYFSKLDMKDAYNQLELHPESRHVTTFSTHIGLFRYTRLVYGLCSAAEIFQQKIFELIQHIPGTKNVWDDIIIYGHTKESHDRSLSQVLQSFSNAGLTLNPQKCEFFKEEILFFGIVFSKKGAQPNDQKYWQ